MLDHAELRNRYSRYCFAVDYGTTTDLLDCFLQLRPADAAVRVAP
ncbi:hypothetical protein [Solicola gregarius]|nr:hypothetical protein [Solicola gregarius]